MIHINYFIILKLSASPSLPLLQIQGAVPCSVPAVRAGVAAAGEGPARSWGHDNWQQHQLDRCWVSVV